MGIISFGGGYFQFAINGTNYCGPGWTAGVFDNSGVEATEASSQFLTSVDKACMDHDTAYGLATNAMDILTADLKLMADIAGLYTQGNIESAYDLVLSVGIFAAFAAKTLLWDLPKAAIDGIGTIIDFAKYMVMEVAEFLGIVDSSSSSESNSAVYGILPEDYYGAANGQTRLITVIALKSDEDIDYEELSEELDFNVEEYTHTNINQVGSINVSGNLLGPTAGVIYLPMSEQQNVEDAATVFTQLSYDTTTVEIPIDMDPWGYNYDSSSSDTYQNSYLSLEDIQNYMFTQNMLMVEEDLRWIEEQVRWIEHESIINAMLKYSNTSIEYFDNDEHIDDTQTDDDLSVPSEDSSDDSSEVLPQDIQNESGNNETVEYIRIDIIDDIVGVVNLKSYLGEDLDEMFELDINQQFRATYVQEEELLYAGDSFYMPADRRSSITNPGGMYFAVSQNTVTIGNDGTLIENSDNDEQHIDDTQTVEYIRIDIIEDIVGVVNLKSYLGEDLEEIFELDINAEFRATYLQEEELLYLGDSFYMPADRRSSIVDPCGMYFAVSQDTGTINDVTTNFCPYSWDPLVLDLNGDSQVSFVELDKSNVFFDLNADSINKHTAWIDKNDGFLVYDENNNKKIDNINELFGNNVVDGFTDLQNRIDSNSDGVINYQDENFNKLKVWQDKNQDGVSQKDELFALDELGITEIRTSNTIIDDNGQITRVTHEGTFVRNGEEHYMADVVFEYDSFVAKFADTNVSDDNFLSLNDINRIIENINSFVVDDGIDMQNCNNIKNNDTIMQIVMSGWN
ncbi:MAG: hypothetical protein LBI78_06170 [Campylobacteraceae bacterium]|jgi:hypothetical protein|nr:hypothetical protein [Campylobacteraceae bacterium]